MYKVTRWNVAILTMVGLCMPLTLHAQGVEEGRLQSQGYGEERPLCDDIPDKMLGKKSRKYNDCRADNRRVEFKITELNGKKVEASDSVKIKKKKEVD